jgi:hypothetical protein
MTTQERKQEIANSSFGIELDEIRTENEARGMFSSIEYHHIQHFTNADLYYIDDETISIYSQGADDVEDTEKGRIYLMK